MMIFDRDYATSETSLSYNEGNYLKAKSSKG